MTRKRLPLVTVIGRPNVGKSTLFNRIVGGMVAVVDDFPGVTRDRREAEASWAGTPFRVVDTGGLVPGTKDSMESAILAQVELALAAADLILFVFDAREGLTPFDREIAERLRPFVERTILVANKVEGPVQEIAAHEGAELGFAVPWAISAQHGRGVGDLLDEVVARIPKRLPEDESDAIRFTLLGRPNVGKSSLANRLLGEPRLIVHPEAGTTRDPVDVPFRYDGSEFVLIDTAGLRRRSHVATGVEYYAAVRTRRSLERSDVALLVLDATQPVANQDIRIARLITETGKSLVFTVNKWDLVEKDTGTTEKFTVAMREAFPQLTGAPILFVSAKSGLRVSRIPPTVRELHLERRRRIPTHELNEALQHALERRQPPVRKDGKPVRLFYATQGDDAPPTFIIFASDPNAVASSYEGFLRNTFRDRLGLHATPIRLVFRERR